MYDAFVAVYNNNNLENRRSNKLPSLLIKRSTKTFFINEVKAYLSRMCIKLP